MGLFLFWLKMKEALSKQAVKLAKQAEEHERFINKVGIFFFLIQVFIYQQTVSLLVLLEMWVGAATSFPPFFLSLPNYLANLIFPSYWFMYFSYVFLFHHLRPFGYVNSEQAWILIFFSFYECSGDSSFGGSWLWLVLLHLWGK